MGNSDTNNIIFKKVLIYSLDEKIKISQLRNNQFEDNYIFTEIQNIITTNQIKFLIDEGGDQNYHYKLQNISHKPYIVYYLGNINLLNQKILGIVGPRNISAYAKDILHNLFIHLNSTNIVTISGLAPGVDKLAHNLSLQYNIPTIAVLGGGILQYMNNYSDAQMIKKIINNNGLVLSEFKLNFVPTGYSFPQRNRIIAGLSDLLFIPEAGEKSGSLITVDFANQMHKKVFGVPNNIFFANAKGINEYLADKKIQLVPNLEKFVQKEIGLRHISPTNEKIINSNLSLSSNEKKILEIIHQHEESDINLLISSLEVDISEIMVSLSNLELKNLIYQSRPGTYNLKENS